MATLNQLKKLAKNTQPLTWKGPIEQRQQASDQQQKNFLGRFALAIDDYHAAERKMKTLKDDGTPDERGRTKTDHAKYDAATKKTSIADMWEERYGDLYNPQRDSIITRSLKLANLRSRLQSERQLKATHDRVRHINTLKKSIKTLNNANNADIRKLNRREPKSPPTNPPSKIKLSRSFSMHLMRYLEATLVRPTLEMALNSSAAFWMELSTPNEISTLSTKKTTLKTSIRQIPIHLVI
jgi:hypothetical protein